VPRLRALGCVAVVAGLLTLASALPAHTAAARTAPADIPTAPAGTTAAWPALPRGATLHIQFAGTLDKAVDATVYEIDGQNSTRATVRSLRRAGRQVVCYLSAGSTESYRPDAKAFPKSVVGKPMDGWPDERWLDVRRTSVLVPIMAKRVADCAAKGFGAVEFDNVDGYVNDTGFPITRAQQIKYDRAMAALAHRYRLAAVLKNAPELVPALVSRFDAALVEQCAEYDECAAFRPFVRAGKAVWDLEYTVPYTRACEAGQAAGIDVQLKNLSLDAYRRHC
jgi:hypothetical protein